jgi:hypothetical protein
MRSAWAILLLAFFSYSQIGPSLFASDADSKLPACCRRDGKHHCAGMATGSESSSGPALQASRCSAFPVMEGAPANRTVAIAGISQAKFDVLIGHRAVAPRTESLSRSSNSRADQKRGPPTFES